MKVVKSVHFKGGILSEVFSVLPPLKHRLANHTKPSNDIVLLVIIWLFLALVVKALIYANDEISSFIRSPSKLLELFVLSVPPVSATHG